jgi:hypothetical protein
MTGVSYRWAGDDALLTSPQDTKRTPCAKEIIRMGRKLFRFENTSNTYSATVSFEASAAKTQ